MAAEGTKRDIERKWNGWGYKDSYFYMEPGTTIGWFAGKERYPFSGWMFPRFHELMDTYQIELGYMTPSQNFEQLEATIPPSVRNEAFIHLLERHNISHSFDKKLRLNRSHGHALEELFQLRHGKIARVPDIVVWPKNHDEVVLIVSVADANNVAIIPVGGATNVTKSLQCPENESRMIVSLDTAKMNRILWVNKENLIARVEAGCIGIELEKELNNRGYTLGHEPDSFEFSTVGGWVATRASGMKRAKYGNIEDLLVHVTLVTPKGILQKTCQTPRMSSGPDMNHFTLGSEGTLGVITEVSLKICEKPECTQYGSMVFPTFEHGVGCMREIAKQKCAPAAMRLVDNVQFNSGKIIKGGPITIWRKLREQIEDLYITSWKGFDPSQVCAMTLVYEGSKKEIQMHEKQIAKIAASFGGFSGGADPGRNGYMFTFAIAYARDIALDYSVIGESMETSVPWDKAVQTVKNVKQLLKKEGEKLGVPYDCSVRVSQAYDDGVCLYFYFAMNYRNLEHPVENLERIEALARDEMLRSGGSISHHHGVGKYRRRWLPVTVGETGISAMRAVKQALDPNNIFASGNLFQPASKL